MFFNGLMQKICVLALFLATVTFSAPSMGKVRSVLGDVTRKKNNEASWAPLRVAMKVFQSDNIKTEIESETILGMPDGSILTIAELSEIRLGELVEENGAYKTTVDVKTGRLAFSAQKQGEASQFKFETGVATASIRGTEGCIDGGDLFLAGLRTGKLEIETKRGQKAMIQGGQVIFEKDSLVVMDLKSAGDKNFHKQLALILKDSTLSMDELKEEVLEADSIYQSKIEEASKGIACIIESLADTVYTSDIMVKGHCPIGIPVDHYGEKMLLDEDGGFATVISMDSLAYGDKQFHFNCTNKKMNFRCGEASTYYAKKKEKREVVSTFTLTSPTPVHICDAGLVIEGTYQTSDTTATLVLSVGSFKSPNLALITNGIKQNFTQVVPVTDANGLWNLKKASLEFKSNGRTERSTIDIEVDKTCKAVNQRPPLVQFVNYDSLRCMANIALGNMEDDIGIFTISEDNIDGVSNIYTRNTNVRIPLSKGIHEYSFKAEDQAHNISNVRRTLGCFPPKHFSVNILGANGKAESVWFPPAPPHSVAVLQKSLRFKVDVLDVSELYQVMVKQNGKIILRETLNQIQSLDYDVRIELQREHENKFEIIAIHKSGIMAKAVKIYEVH